MKIKYYTNACCEYESDGRRLLCDPWLSESAFYGTWWHTDELKHYPEKPDYIYVSHLHEDHYDKQYMSAWKDVPIIILDDGGPNFLEKILKRDGFSNIFKIKDRKSDQFGPFVVTMYKAFNCHPFVDCEIGNIIDSAMAVTDGPHTVLNCNDNTPTVENAKWLKEALGDIDVLQINYNAAGPYPACFVNMSKEDREEERQRLIMRNLEHMVAVAKVIKPRYTMPFAGDFILGGSKYEMNEYNGVTTIGVAASYLYGRDVQPFVLKHGETQDLAEQRFYTKDWEEGITVEYEQELMAKPEYKFHGEVSRMLFREATYNMVKYQKWFNCWPDYKVRFIGGDKVFNYDFSTGDVLVECKKPDLSCKMSEGLFSEILQGKVHWNNAEIGFLIEFYREPNVYNPDVHVLLPFLHV